jgi:hypothetical protein
MRFLVALALVLAFVVDGGGARPVDAGSTPTIRAAFYYAWYPEQWAAAGRRAASIQGEYDSGQPKVIANHVNIMKYARIDAAIYSWWGRDSLTDRRFMAHLDADPEFHWAIYYELDQDGRRAAAAVYADVEYLSSTYFDHPSYLHIDGKPVIFVYAPRSSCARNAEWELISANGVYVSITDFPRWWTCKAVDSWHGYAPANRVKAVWDGTQLYSMSVSAGFWASSERRPRLERDFATWEAAVQAVQRYGPQWELYYYNEFGEGTNIEPSDVRCERWLCSDYVDTLARTRDLRGR